MFSKFSISQMHQLAGALEGAGFTPDDVTELGQNKSRLSDLLGVLRDTHEVKAIEHLIDCDADPFTPNGWKVEEHKQCGKIEFGAANIEFYLSKKQGSGVIEGHKLREELKGGPVLNANVLDYLLENPHLIPEDWKKDEHGNTRFIFFWGTIYRCSGGSLCVRCLFWSGGQWHWRDDWLECGWNSLSPAALFAPTVQQS